MTSFDAPARPLQASFLAATDVQPDPFQQTAFDALDDELNVLVSAPTGSGKTLVGEYAAHRALSRAGRCVYTTPIKALSNQKFRQFRSRFGSDTVGLLTGDHSINSDGDVLVMTTEVLRNMIYAESPTLERLSCVVMDEIHYLGDRSRGVVWEEIILTLANHVQLVGLSATVSNATELGDWMSDVRGPTTVVQSSHRPVPLRHMLYTDGDLVPITDALTRHTRRGTHHDQRLAAGRTALWATRRAVIDTLDDAALLPAIYFVFSRAGCDGAVEQMRRSRLRLTSAREARIIGAYADNAITQMPPADRDALDFHSFRASLMAGVAAHHAGMLPLFRTIVEELFAEGLLKVVFATETLALGIHMPARAVVLEKLTKYDGEGHVPLTAAQYSQITGRAGRRGIDTLGTAITLSDPELDVHLLLNLVNSPTFPLRSAFAPDYSMAVNLVATIGERAAEELVERSFAQYQTAKTVVRATKERDAARRQAQLRAAELAALDPPAELDSYMDKRLKLSALERDHKRASREQAAKDVSRALASTSPGDVLIVDRPRLALLATVLTVRVDSATSARVLCVLDNGRTKWLDARDFQRPPPTIARLVVPEGRSSPSGGVKKRLIAQMERLIPKARARARKARRVQTTSDPQIAATRKALHAHPVHRAEQVEVWAHAWLAAHDAQRRATEVEQRMEDDQASLARRFRRIVHLLTEFGYLARTDSGAAEVTAAGELLAQVHSDQELLITECVRTGAWDGLDAPELAACVAVIVAHGRRHTVVRAPQSPRLQQALLATEQAAQRITAAERTRHLPVTPHLDMAMAPVIHHWVSGGTLSEVLAASWHDGIDLTAGDFVRSARLVLDGLIQVAKVATAETTRNARRAADAIHRGVVEDTIT